MQRHAKHDEYLRHAKDFQDYRARRHFLMHASPDEVEAELEELKGHARVFGREGGGAVIEHHLEDGSVEEHHFDGSQHDEALAHLHGLIADDFNQEENK
jgi:hypothetical protein